MIHVPPSRIEDLRHVDQLYQYRFSIPSAYAPAPTTFETYRLQIGGVDMYQLLAGKLVQFRISCESPDYMFSLRTKNAWTTPTDFDEVDEILMVSGIVNHYDEMDLHVFFSNNDVPEELPYLYLYLYAVDPAPVGDIELELVISRSRQRFTRLTSFLAPYATV